MLEQSKNLSDASKRRIKFNQGKKAQNDLVPVFKKKQNEPGAQLQLYEAISHDQYDLALSYLSNVHMQRPSITPMTFTLGVKKNLLC